MVLISITSDPNDFLSAPPPDFYSRNSGSGKPVHNWSNGTGAVTVAGNIGGNNDKSGTRHRTNRHQSSNANVKHQQSLAKINMSSVAGAGGGTNPIASRKFQQLSEIIFTEDDEYEFPTDSVNSLQQAEYEQLQEKLLATCITNSSDAKAANICAAESTAGKEEQEKVAKDDKTVTSKNSSSETEGITMLMGACQQGLEHDVRAILRRKPGIVKQVDRTGKTALHYCAENQNTACLDQMLDVSPSLLEQADNEGYTPLHLAVIAGNTLVIRYMLTKKADKNTKDLEHHSPVHWAVICGQLEALDVLCNCGADIDTPDIYGAYPIHYAAQMCGSHADHTTEKSRIFLVVLRKLLARGADPNVLDKDLRPPILWAASAGSADAYLALVNYGASSDNVDKDGLAAIHCAASRGHKECLSILITLCGADVNLRDGNGCTALFYTVTLGYVECTELLLSSGADTDIRDRKGRTPSHCGAAKGQLETLKLLKHYDANLCFENDKGELPLHDAVRSGRKDLIRWWLHLYGDLVDKTNKDGKTALHLAAASKNADICSLLVDFQADINKVAVGQSGKLSTPLDYAIYRGNKSCARYLVGKGGTRSSKLLRAATTKIAAIKNFSILGSDQPSDAAANNTVDSCNETTRNAKPSVTDVEDSDSDQEQQSRCLSRKKSFVKKRSSSQGTKASKKERNSPYEARTPSVTQKTNLSDSKEFQDGKFLNINSRLIKSPFQPPPKSPFGNSDELQQESDPFQDSSHLDTDELLNLFSPLNEEPVVANTETRKLQTCIENINDENIGRQLIIEKHLEHQMLLKKQNNGTDTIPSLPEQKKNNSSQYLETDTFSIGEFSTAFHHKGNSDDYTLNGTLRLTRKAERKIDLYCTNNPATSKELRKLKQESFLVEELIQAREAGARYRQNRGRVTVSVKRLIDNFNKKITSKVGYKTYSGPISFFFFEKFLMDELTKLNINTSNSHIFWNPKPFSDCGKTLMSSKKSSLKRAEQRLILPKIQTGISSVSETDYLEVRHGKVSKFIKLPSHNPNKQVSVTFTIKPKRRNYPGGNMSNW